ncbi:hypothetical protein CALVIDRAFT_502257 [Calocera viscosa TUFC12733]|uniref:P-loop containing nucleoside triphosphate hydrolase protein n=1 Tax=Calocera viscosa (strain TUFC12733) TaxID=1330018 RepID=A0A167JTY2_CALVF|nr:hypothetical protein CALVIDRAFT_502257 [Calocera viscosa TUFC12733]
MSIFRAALRSHPICRGHSTGAWRALHSHLPARTAPHPSTPLLTSPVLRSIRFQSTTPTTPPPSAPAVPQPAPTPTPTAPTSSSAPPLPPAPPAPPPPPPTPPKPPLLTRLLPATLQPAPESASNVWKLFRLAGPERKPLTIAVGLLLISSSVTMSIPFTIGKLIDFFSNPGNTTFLGLSFTSASALLLSLFLVGACANTGRVILMRTAGQRIVARIRNRAYASALRQEIDYVERQGGGSGDIVSRLNADTYIVGDSVTGNLSDGLRAIVTASVGLGLMLYLSSKLTLVMLAVVPPISIGAVFYGRYLKKLSNQTQEALGDMSRVAEETLSAIRTVQASNSYPMEERTFSEKVQLVFELARREALASGLFFGGTGFSGNVTILTLLGYGGSLVAHGEISVGDLTSLLLYTAYVGGALSNLSGFFSSLMRGVGAGERVFSLIDRVPAVQPGVGEAFVPTARGVIRFENVGFRYPSRPDVMVLQGFNMELRTGESVALVGKSGSGKSSVQALMLRYYDPTEGRITFNGRDIREFTPESWRATIGYVPQEPVLFSGTIGSNIAYGRPDATLEDIAAAAQQANCDFVHAFPLGYDTPVGRNSLSGGQRQRIAIARALIRKPAILCLDEATAALDAVSEYRVNDAIQRIISSKQTSSIVVAHRLSTITTAERLVVLEDGRISESGTYRELASRENSRFRALMAAQLNIAAGEKSMLEEATAESDSETLVDEEEPEERIIDDVQEEKNQKSKASMQ